MGAMGIKLRTVQGGCFLFWCPGCDEAHIVGPTWEFNNDGNAPTFHPSILVRGKRKMTEDEYQRIMAGEKLHIDDTVCHSFILNGYINFLGDCTHSMAGQLVPLPDFPAGEE